MSEILGLHLGDVVTKHGDEEKFNQLQKSLGALGVSSLAIGEQVLPPTSFESSLFMTVGSEWYESEWPQTVSEKVDAWEEQNADKFDNKFMTAVVVEANGTPQTSLMLTSEDIKEAFVDMYGKSRSVDVSAGSFISKLGLCRANLLGLHRSYLLKPGRVAITSDPDRHLKNTFLTGRSKRNPTYGVTPAALYGMLVEAKKYRDYIDGGHGYISRNNRLGLGPAGISKGFQLLAGLALKKLEGPEFSEG